MPKNEHLTDEEAMDFAAGRLRASEHSRLTAHLRDCSRCRELDAFWRRTEAAARQRHTIDAPESAVRRAIALFDPALLPEPAWKRLLAPFVFDTRREMAPAGVRDAGGSFQLLAQAEDVEIDLLCEAEGEGWRITGQVIASTPVASGLARAVVPIAVETPLGASGEFQLRGVPSGEIGIEIETEAWIVTLEPFQLGGQGD